MKSTERTIAGRLTRAIAICLCVIAIGLSHFLQSSVHRATILYYADSHHP